MTPQQAIDSIWSIVFGGVFNAVADIATAMSGLLTIVILIFAFTMIMKVLSDRREREEAQTFIGSRITDSGASDDDWIKAENDYIKSKKASSIKRKYGFE